MINEVTRKYIKTKYLIKIFQLVFNIISIFVIISLKITDYPKKIPLNFSSDFPNNTSKCHLLSLNEIVSCYIFGWKIRLEYIFMITNIYIFYILKLFFPFMVFYLKIQFEMHDLISNKIKYSLFLNSYNLLKQTEKYICFFYHHFRYP